MTSFYHLAGGPTWEVISQDTDLKHFHLLKNLVDQDVFWANVGWPEQHWQLPLGHRGYVLMVEGPEITWLEKQAARIDAPVIVLGMVNQYGYHCDDLIYVPWVEWHYQTKEMLAAFSWMPKTHCTHLVSSLSARVTQNKIWSTMALLDHVAEDQRLISISDRIDLKNVHDWTLTDNRVLDDLTQRYRRDLLGRPLMIDDFDHHRQSISNNHDYTSRAYRDAVFNVNNESWHYSFKHTPDRRWTYPGPFLTEKTMKCLLSETAIIANGQFDTYRTLESLGMEFDYGLDLSHDTEPGNIDRAVGMVDLIACLGNHGVDYWFDRTWQSRRHNREHIISGDFYDACESINLRSLDLIQQVLS
jgi:hypothetical protein